MRCCAANEASLGSDGVSCFTGLFEFSVRKDPNMEIPPPAFSCARELNSSGVLAGWPTSHEGAARFSRRSRSSARCRSISGVRVRAGGVETGDEEGISGGGRGREKSRGEEEVREGDCEEGAGVLVPLLRRGFAAEG